MMKKLRLVVIGILLITAVCMLAGCGNTNDNDSGSNTDPGNNTNSSGIIDEIVTDAATDAKEIATDAATEAKDLATDAADGIRDMFSETQTDINNGQNTNDYNAGTDNGSGNTSTQDVR